MSFIYLMPGNWFELKNINADKTYPFDLDALKEEILNQVNCRSEKLGFINLSFGSKYRNNVVEDIVFHLDEKKFSKMVEMLETEMRHPIITFHGTSLDATNSILENGYIIPKGHGSNQKQNKNNIIVKTTHGSAYGTGIYSSPFFDKAMYYAKPDGATHVYIIINIVFLGTMKLIPPGHNFTDFKAPINGSYPDGSNTRIVYGLDQLVLADPERIYPVAIMKIRIA
jgi:hypothetical protein